MACDTSQPLSPTTTTRQDKQALRRLRGAFPDLEILFIVNKIDQMKGKSGCIRHTYGKPHTASSHDCLAPTDEESVNRVLDRVYLQLQETGCFPELSGSTAATCPNFHGISARATLKAIQQCKPIPDRTLIAQVLRSSPAAWHHTNNVSHTHCPAGEFCQVRAVAVSAPSA